MVTPPPGGSDTGPRIAPLAREEWTEAARDVFAYWEGPTARIEGSRSNTMMTLANHPPLALASLDLGRYFMLSSRLTARQIKMLILRIAHRYGSVYQWTHNALAARGLGLTEEQIEAIREGPNALVWDLEDRLFLRTIDEVGNGGRIGEETWQALGERYDRQAIMDLVHAVGYFTMVAWGLVAMGVEVEPDFAEFSKNRAKEE